MVGSSLGYDNLFRYVINNQQVEKDVADMMENYQDFVHNWLDYQYDDIKKYFDNNTQLLGIEKMFGAIVCGVKDKKIFMELFMDTRQMKVPELLRLKLIKMEL